MNGIDKNKLDQHIQDPDYQNNPQRSRREFRIFFKKIEIVDAEYNNKWIRSDTRRKLVKVIFNTGEVWYPRNIELEEIIVAQKQAFQHNIQYPNIDPKPEKIDPIEIEKKRLEEGR